MPKASPSQASSAEASIATAPSSTFTTLERKPPSTWARALRTDPSVLAGAAILQGWERDPQVEVTQADYEAALAAFEGIQVT